MRRECVQPEYGIFNEMNDEKSGKVGEWQHSVGASSTVLNGADVPLGVWDMFPSSTCVQAGVGRTQGLKIVVNQNCGDMKTAVLVGVHYCL